MTFVEDLDFIVEGSRAELYLVNLLLKFEQYFKIQAKAVTIPMSVWTSKPKITVTRKLAALSTIRRY